MGRHYDLARQMCNYWTNFMKTGNPNGDDADGMPMPHWESYKKGGLNEMVFGSEGFVPTVEDDKLIQFMIKKIQRDLT